MPNPCPLCGAELYKMADKWFKCHNVKCKAFMRIFLEGDNYFPNDQHPELIYFPEDFTPEKRPAQARPEAEAPDKLGPLFRRTQ